MVAPKIATLPFVVLWLGPGTAESTQAVAEAQSVDAPVHVEPTIEMERLDVLLKAPVVATKLTDVLVANAVGVP